MIEEDRFQDVVKNVVNGRLTSRKHSRNQAISQCHLGITISRHVCNQSILYCPEQDIILPLSILPSGCRMLVVK
jgi:hypothetical protein